MQQKYLYNAGIALIGLVVILSSGWFILQGQFVAGSDPTFPLLGAIIGIIVGTLLLAKDGLKATSF